MGNNFDGCGMVTPWSQGIRLSLVPLKNPHENRIIGAICPPLPLFASDEVQLTRKTGGGDGPITLLLIRSKLKSDISSHNERKHAHSHACRAVVRFSEVRSV
jgi:hypothetical protein